MSRNKAVRRISPIMQYSINNGDIYQVAGTTYCGKPPVYKNLETRLGYPANFVKVQRGIPFVRSIKQAA